MLITQSFIVAPLKSESVQFVFREDKFNVEEEEQLLDGLSGNVAVVDLDRWDLPNADELSGNVAVDDLERWDPPNTDELSGNVVLDVEVDGWQEEIVKSTSLELETVLDAKLGWFVCG